MFSYVLPYYLLHINWPFSSACFFQCTKFHWFQYKEHKVCLTKIPPQSMFKLLLVIYFQNMCIMEINALPCFLTGYGTVLETTNITCIMPLPDGGLLNGTKLTNLIKYC